MSQVASNLTDLDIDDGTQPVAEAPQTDTPEADDFVEGDEIDSVDGQDDEAEETTGETEPAVTTTKQPEAEAKPEAVAPKIQEAFKPTDYAEMVRKHREEFGEEAAAPFSELAAKTESLEKLVKQIVDERNDYAQKSDQQIAVQHMTTAGIDPKQHSSVYQDAVDYFTFKKSQGKAVEGMDALKWAIRANGGNPDAKPTSPKAEQAAKLQKLRSVQPKTRAAPVSLDLDDPAVADGTAPARK
jgi:hypothetical protein